MLGGIGVRYEKVAEQNRKPVVFMKQDHTDFGDY